MQIQNRERFQKIKMEYRKLVCVCVWLDRKMEPQGHNTLGLNKDWTSCNDDVTQHGPLSVLKHLRARAQVHRRDAPSSARLNCPAYRDAHTKGTVLLSAQLLHLRFDRTA